MRRCDFTSGTGRCAEDASFFAFPLGLPDEGYAVCAYHLSRAKDTIWNTLINSEDDEWLVVRMSSDSYLLLMTERETSKTNHPSSGFWVRDDMEVPEEWQ